MILRRTLPPSFVAWNRRWGAPHGHRIWRRVLQGRLRPLGHRLPRLLGPFGLQLENDTRTVEYPWAFAAGRIRPGLDVIDLGGSLCGFQFALAASGARVRNVDPGEEATGVGWPVDRETIGRLNRAFRTDVELLPCTLEHAGIPEGSVDVVFSISTLEHIPVDELTSLAAEIGRVLKPGGRAVLTVDLFLDLVPFSDKPVNGWGTNVSIRELVEQTGLELTEGRTSELHGYPEFDPKRILAQLPEYHLGSGYPSLAQAVVLTKRS